MEEERGVKKIELEREREKERKKDQIRNKEGREENI